MLIEREPTGAKSWIILHVDPDADAGRARRAFESHMFRARWMTEHGYRLLLHSAF
jgi:hypothetical protein